MMKINGRLENWMVVHCPWDGNIYIDGNIYDDSKKRFIDGYNIQTSYIPYLTTKLASKLEEGVIIKTRNSKYILGKPFNSKYDVLKEFDFWKATEEVHSKVEEWPDWKRNIRLTEYSTGLGKRNPNAKKAKKEEQQDEVGYDWEDPECDVFAAVRQIQELLDEQLKRR